VTLYEELPLYLRAAPAKTDEHRDLRNQSLTSRKNQGLSQQRVCCRLVVTTETDMCSHRPRSIVSMETTLHGNRCVILYRVIIFFSGSKPCACSIYDISLRVPSCSVRNLPRFLQHAEFALPQDVLQLPISYAVTQIYSEGPLVLRKRFYPSRKFHLCYVLII
jgi:hypothetical protein